MAERFLDEIDCAALDRAHCRGHVAVPRDENDRDLDVPAIQVFLQLETAHARQFEIQHEAPGVAVPIGVDELRGRGEGPH